jgi:addiction module HigA family antidote
MLPANRIATHSGQILLSEFLEPMHLTQAQLARSRLNRVHELVRPERGVTPATALLLAEHFENAAEFSMNLQSNYDLSRARSDMKKKPMGTARRFRRRVGASLEFPEKEDHSEKTAISPASAA